MVNEKSLISDLQKSLARISKARLDYQFALRCHMNLMSDFNIDGRVRIKNELDSIDRVFKHTLN